MPTDSDCDSLARIIFTATVQAGWQAWEQTSDGLRAWCRAKADEAMAAGWRKVGADQVVVSSSTAITLELTGDQVETMAYGLYLAVSTVKEQLPNAHASASKLEALLALLNQAARRAGRSGGSQRR